MYWILRGLKQLLSAFSRANTLTLWESERSSVSVVVPETEDVDERRMHARVAVPLVVGVNDVEETSTPVEVEAELPALRRRLQQPTEVANQAQVGTVESHPTDDVDVDDAAVGVLDRTRVVDRHLTSRVVPGRRVGVRRFDAVAERLRSGRLDLQDGSVPPATVKRHVGEFGQERRLVEVEVVEIDGGDERRSTVERVDVVHVRPDNARVGHVRVGGVQTTVGGRKVPQLKVHRQPDGANRGHRQSFSVERLHREDADRRRARLEDDVQLSV